MFVILVIAMRITPFPGSRSNVRKSCSSGVFIILIHLGKEPADAVELQLRLGEDVGEAAVGGEIILMLQLAQKQLYVGLHRPRVEPDLPDHLYIILEENMLPDEA